jgi:hypothetical protein
MTRASFCSFAADAFLVHSLCVGLACTTFADIAVISAILFELHL